MPTVKNTRIPVSLIVACLKDEMTFQEICEEYKIAPEGVEKVMEAIGNFLKSKGVGTIIHYPIPPHLSEAYQYLNIGQDVLPITEHYANSVLSIPMYAGISEEEQAYVIENINAFT